MEKVSRRNSGMVPRALSHIFDYVYSHPQVQWTITLSFLQIYVENVQDLLAPEQDNLPIRESPRHGFYVEGLKQVCLRRHCRCAANAPHAPPPLCSSFFPLPALAPLLRSHR